MSGSLLPQPVEMQRVTVVLTRPLVDDLDRIAKETKTTHPPNGLTRQKVIESFLENAVRQHREGRP